MSDSEALPAPPPENSASSAWPLYALLVLAALTLLTLQLRRPRQPNEFAGSPLPPLHVAGWLNADPAPTREALRGKLVLVDYWETNCYYCVLNMPSLVKLKDKYRDRGLVVIGLTPELDEPFGQLSRYVDSVPGLDWPIGYGAGLTLDMAGIDMFPTYVLYDTDGRALWGGADLDELEDALVQRLARG